MNDGDNMVERVARALCEDCGLDWATASQDGWMRQARAAIGAIRAYMDEKHGHADRYFREAFDNECDEALK